MVTRDHAFVVNQRGAPKKAAMNDQGAINVKQNWSINLFQRVVIQSPRVKEKASTWVAQARERRAAKMRTCFICLLNLIIIAISTMLYELI